MKHITLLLLLIGMTSMAQIKGNKKIETRTFEIENVTHIKINFYAKITIDQSAREHMTITTDSNLFDRIDKTVVDGILHLDQKEWISPSQNAIITIGAPHLKRIESGTHDITKLININSDLLQINAPIGRIIVEGKTKELRLGAELASIDASKLIAENAFVNLWSYGKAKVNVTNTLWAEVANDGELVYVNTPKKIDSKTKNGGRVSYINSAKKVKNGKISFINFKIKNNSPNRNHFYVIGPKSDGSKFSYGFPMMPNAKRHEDWSVGTKVFKVNSLGFRKLLVTIKKEDEGKTINLF